MPTAPGSTTARRRKSWNSSHPSRAVRRRLQPGRSQEHGRQRFLLLLRRELRTRCRETVTTSPLGCIGKSLAEAGLFLLPVADKTTDSFQGAKSCAQCPAAPERRQWRLRAGCTGWAGAPRRLSTCFTRRSKALLRVRHDELELREPVLIRLDVVAVLHLVEAIRGILLARDPPSLSSSAASDLARIRAHGGRSAASESIVPGDGDQRLLDVARSWRSRPCSRRRRRTSAAA